MTDKRIANNQRYNAERKAQTELIKRDVDRDELLAAIYKESFDRLQRQIDQFYLAYAGKEGLTKQEAMKRVSEMDVTKFNDKAAKAVREKDFSHGTNQWLRTYNLKMKVSRLELLKQELALEIQNLTAEVNEVFDKARHDEQQLEFKRQSGILGNSSSGVKRRLQGILDADFYGQKFSNRVWGTLGLRATLQRDVFGSLNRIFTDMMGYKQEMKRLAKKYGTSEQNAKRLLKTEIARINADTQLAMLKENGFTHLIYVAEPGACEVCQALDGKAIPIEEVEKGVNMYPMHPNCRCSSYGHIKMEYKAGGSTLDEYKIWDDSDIQRLKNLSSVPKNGIIDSEVDRWSQCLIRLSDEEVVDTEISDYIPKKNELKDWNFDFYADYEAGDKVKALRIVGSDEIEALISYHREPNTSAVYVTHIERKPGDKIYDGITAHMFAEAIAESFAAGYDGVVFFDTKNQKLNKHYADELGAVNISKFRMAIFEKKAKELHDYYNFKRNSK